MADSPSLTIPVLRQQEAELVLPSFDESAAWEIGSDLRRRSADAGHPITIDISSPFAVLFRAALPGHTPDQQDWVRRKAATVFRFAASSALVAAQVEERLPGADGLPCLDAQQYAITGGSFPIRVEGAGIVGAVTISGLTSEEDHLLAVDALRRARETR